MHSSKTSRSGFTRPSAEGPVLPHLLESQLVAPLHQRSSDRSWLSKWCSEPTEMVFLAQACWREQRVSSGGGHSGAQFETAGLPQLPWAWQWTMSKSNQISSTSAEMLV